MTDMFETETAMAAAFASAGFEIAQPATGDEGEEPRAASATAAVCEHAALYRATPDRDEFDTREVWDEDDAIAAVLESFRILGRGACPEGTQLADERESLLWGFVNMLDAQTRRIDRAADRLMPDLRDLQTRPGRHRDQVARAGTPDPPGAVPHRPPRRVRADARRGRRSPTAPTPATSGVRGADQSRQPDRQADFSAAIDARDYMRARKDRETAAHLPQGTLIAIAGGRDIANPAAVIASASTRPAPSMRTSCSSTAAAPASSASPRSGPSATASTRSSASPTGTATDAPPRSAATTSC